ncbi:MAG: molybdate ABC transporter permease subunit, partial [Anaerolineales bacterium]|nr:molybdate ABC transporter permease subunit [Anaerolineales bacterium]
LQAIGISLSTSLISTSLVVTFGTPLSLVLARKNLRFKRILDTLIDLPAVLPPAVAGLALLLAFGRRGSVGAPLADLGITLAFTPLAVVLAQVFVAAPFYIKSAAAGFAAVDEELQQAAALDGASRWKIFRYITAPLAWSAVLGGAVMTWARALGEFGATIIFAGNFTGRTQTMPLAIYLGLELSVDVALTLSLVLIGLSFLALLVVKGLLHREWR